jgi:hypothetical protein
MSEVTVILRAFAPFIAGTSLGFIAYKLATSVNLDVSGVRSATARRLERFAGGEREPTFMDRVGDRAIGALGLDPHSWELRLEWAQLGGHFLDWTVGSMFGRALLYGAGGAAYAAIIGVPVLWLAAPVLFTYPFLTVRSKANEVRRHVMRGLPETATLIAAEMAAGNAPDQALMRTSELSGPLGRLLAKAIAESRSSKRPLFSRGKEVTGVLVESLARMQLSELMAFASQLDLVAERGAAGPELMDNIARGLAREHHRRVRRAAEELESNLVVPMTLFFFLPFVAAILIPLFIPLLGMF